MSGYSRDHQAHMIKKGSNLITFQLNYSIYRCQPALEHRQYCRQRI